MAHGMMENRLLCYCATVQWGQKGQTNLGWPQALQWPAPTAAGRQQQNQPSGLGLERKTKQGIGVSKQVPPAPALGCIQRTIKNHVCGVLHAQLAVGADARLPGLVLPPARFLSTPMGAGAQLRQRLLLPPPHRLQVGVALPSAGGTSPGPHTCRT
jgi:hypothetical protein